MSAKNLKLQDGQRVRLVVPFEYEIGDENPITGQPIETLNDCYQAVIDELEAGLTNPHIEMDCDGYIVDKE